MEHPSEEVGAPGEEELKTQLANSYRTPYKCLLLHSAATDPCSLALPHSLATLPVPCRIGDRQNTNAWRWQSHPWEIVRAGRQIWRQSPGPRPVVPIG